ncbi:MAG: hypothetical protein NWE93_13645 [Candidatus Bathyarchaeota archaeon]|nr:hypothetical protein [Candidatus Bathyarchaeota archaeon]
MLLICVFLLIQAAAATAGNSSCEPKIYGDTTVYASYNQTPNITITVESIVNQANATTFNFTLQVSSPFKIQNGPLINTTAYHQRGQAGLLEAYFDAGVAVDYEDGMDNALWLFGKNSASDFYGAESALRSHSCIDINFTQRENIYHGTVTLPMWSEGSTHTLTVWVRAQQNYLSYFDPLWIAISKTVTYTVDHTPPDIAILCPTASQYTTASLPLNFSVNEPISQATYSIDNSEALCTEGNQTLTGLTIGEHNITVYAWDNSGNMGTSQTISFSINPPAQAADVLLEIAAVASVAAVVAAAGLVVHYRKKQQPYGS